MSTNSSGTTLSRYPADRPLEDDTGTWWVLHTKPNSEKLVAQYLMNREVSYYMPLLIKKKRVGGLKRLRTIVVPLFRGYLSFALDREKHYLLHDSKKFVRIIEVVDQERFVRELVAISKAIESHQDILVCPGIVPGKEVLIRSGPLAGYEGRVVQKTKQRKLALSVNMFNRSVVVTLDSWTDLEPL
ncbi:transcription termination/antitermination protein NusG [Thermodesulfobacteriota bacterium]